MQATRQWGWLAQQGARVLRSWAGNNWQVPGGRGNHGYFLLPVSLLQPSWLAPPLSTLVEASHAQLWPGPLSGATGPEQAAPHCWV